MGFASLVDLFSLGRLEIGDPNADEPDLPPVLLELLEQHGNVFLDQSQIIDVACACLFSRKGHKSFEPNGSIGLEIGRGSLLCESRNSAHCFNPLGGSIVIRPDSEFSTGRYTGAARASLTYGAFVGTVIALELFAIFRVCRSIFCPQYHEPALRTGGCTANLD